MKRRKFIQNIGLGATPVILPKINLANHESFPVYSYTQPTRLKDAITKEGQIILRIEITSANVTTEVFRPNIKIKDGNIARTKTYYFEQGEDEFISDQLQGSLSQAYGDADIIVLWLDTFSEKTILKITEKGKDKFSFQLNDLLENQEAAGQIGETKISANFLLDKEIGEIIPADVGIQDSGDDFSFLIMADPQGGDTSNPEDNRARMKIHNTFVEESVKLANNLKTKPAFCIMLGDIVDHQGEARDFAQMARFFDKLNMPVLYEMGNHESRYSTRFTPGYNLSGFNNYFAAQMALNGMEKLLYSFNMGQWHFVVWPDPLRQGFWENHPHYFDWLENDLAKNKNRPTIFLQHIPMHPIGINPLINYAESVTVKRLLFKILAKHGNVNAIFSGHVHIPVKASFKTAVNVGGINCINLPAAGYRPRAFGEQDYNGGPAQGLVIVDILGDKLTATYKTVTLEEYEYPKKLPVFEEKKYPLWLKHKWELPAENKLKNGDFSNGLTDWGRRYVYTEDVHPSNICDVRNAPDGNRALFLQTRRRGFCTPGQDRLPQDINRIFQAVKVNSSASPVLSFNYWVDKNSKREAWNGAYIWVEAFRGSVQVVNLIYFINKAWVNMGGTYGRNNRREPIIFQMEKTSDKWHNTQINIQNDYNAYSSDKTYHELRPDRLVLSLGMWNINDGPEQNLACYFNNFELKHKEDTQSAVNNMPIQLAPDNIKWWRGKEQPSTNTAGEHHYFTEGYNQLKY